MKRMKCGNSFKNHFDNTFTPYTSLEYAPTTKIFLKKFFKWAVKKFLWCKILQKIEKMRKIKCSINFEDSFDNTFLQDIYLESLTNTIFKRSLLLSLKETTCETMKNVFHFTSKTIFVLTKTKV